MVADDPELRAPDDAPAANLPQCPPKALDPAAVRRAEHGSSTGSVSPPLANKHADDPDQDKMRLPWWSRYAGYQKLRQSTPAVLRAKRTRRALCALAAAVSIVLIVVLAWEYTKKGQDYETRPRVKLPQGTYVGDVSEQSSRMPRAVDAFRGIPYAQSTAGQNRFRPPQPLENLSAADVEYQAIDYGDICPQVSYVSGQSEDCLNLNLFRPRFGRNATADAEDMAKIGGAGTLLPAVIYVHGGAFNTGSGKERNMASFVSWAETPIIGISFNYRVGALGFLPSGWSEDRGLLNVGLKDQQMLFSWVQQNLKYFGGDPNNVTIMGLSAGSHSIGHHLISYSPANKLTSDPVPFQRAILESGAATARACFNPTHPLHEKQFHQFLHQLGLNKTSPDDLLDALRRVPIGTMVSTSYYVFHSYYTNLQWAFQPVIEGPGGVIPDMPLQSWKKGNVLRIPILTGFDTDEGVIFTYTLGRSSDPTTLSGLMSPMIPALNDTDIEYMEDVLYPDPSTTAGKKRYPQSPPSGYGAEFWRIDDCYGHYAYICPVLQTAHFASTSSSDAPVFVYHFAALSASYGATDHGDEAPLVAHDMSVIGEYPGLVAAAHLMNGAWTRFAVFNDTAPTGSTDGNLTWPRYVSGVKDSGATTTVGQGQGQLALFAEGNDERMGDNGGNWYGIPGQVTRLAEREATECAWWWDRVVFSQGFGNGSLAIPKGRAKSAEARTI